MSNQREPYLLNEVEYDILREALFRQEKMNLVFEKFGLNTAYYVSSYRRSHKLKSEFMPVLLDNGNSRELTPEEKEKALRALEKAKKALREKMRIK